jgi:hypothetical protein
MDIRNASYSICEMSVASFLTLGNRLEMLLCTDHQYTENPSCSAYRKNNS